MEREDTIMTKRLWDFCEEKDLEKRKQVFDTAVTYYYNQACRVVEGMRVAEEYRAKANRTVREIRN